MCADKSSSWVVCHSDLQKIEQGVTYQYHKHYLNKKQNINKIENLIC